MVADRSRVVSPIAGTQGCQVPSDPIALLQPPIDGELELLPMLVLPLAELETEGDTPALCDETLGLAGCITDGLGVCTLPIVGAPGAGGAPMVGALRVGLVGPEVTTPAPVEELALAEVAAVAALCA